MSLVPGDSSSQGTEPKNVIDLLEFAARCVSERRYDKASTIITSNKPFEQWGEIFNDDVVAAAILDRVLHHSYPLFIQGESYRTKELMGNKA